MSAISHPLQGGDSAPEILTNYHMHTLAQIQNLVIYLIPLSAEYTPGVHHPFMSTVLSSFSFPPKAQSMVLLAEQCFTHIYINQF